MAPPGDVAATRITDVMPLPAEGVFAGEDPHWVAFFDGAESLRRQDENPRAKFRPRGYSCEEIGGAMIATQPDLADAQRLSRLAPWFLSPHGTGSSRYASTLVTQEGIWATWQQAQPSGAQPLVGHFLPMARVIDLLS
ncbi:MAG: hypothetical protein HC915_01575 [Anaerolineae bacterium]|nr:hypothetical protein [Anaerolineae bacterium]